MLREAGFEDVRIRGEELLPTSTAGPCARSRAAPSPSEVPDRWRELAFRSYLALQRLDAALLEPRLPASLFYNLVLSARKSA